MYLKKLAVKNFRVIKALELDFHEGVNILIGENNSGKSAIIDVLRIVFSYGSQWRDIGIHLCDFHIERNSLEPESSNIEFDLFFCITIPEESGWFNELLSINPINGDQELALHFKYYKEKIRGEEVVRWRVWGGDNEGQRVSSEVLEMLAFVYLEALRDSTQYLRPIRGSKLGQLYHNVVTEEEKREHLAQKLRTTLHDDDEWEAVITEGKNKVNAHLKETSIKGKEQQVDINFLPFEFKRLVENLRIQMPIFPSEILNGNEDKQRYFEVYQNGLGQNNLIYIATILGNLKQKTGQDHESYLALLIEEPEAHLHPQLQKILFDYLGRLNNLRVQLFITSHSPTITAKSNLDSLIILQKQKDIVTSLAIRESALTHENKKYLSKFLDVTKSQLFFANGVILVEGISELLLMPIFSQMMGIQFDTEKNGIEIVNINGVAFSHFARLFNPADPRKRLAARCSIITDDDRSSAGKESSRALRAQFLEKGMLKVFLGRKTFEYELFTTGRNKDILLDVFRKIKPRAASNLNLTGVLESDAEKFANKISANKAKSEFAHKLAIALEEDASFRAMLTVPEYIKKAIEWVIAGN